VLRTAGALSSLVLCEIKHHRTDLLHKSYRGDAWSISREVAGDVAQCQATSDDVERDLGPMLDLKTPDGYLDERVFVCRPRTILVVGALSQFVADDRINPARFESFERFRRGLRDPEILTFDELFDRARFVLDLQDEIAAAAEAA
jgi:Shedu protein SduA, C-terminal